ALFLHVVPRDLSSSSLPRSHPVFFLNGPPTAEIYTLSLHDALPIYQQGRRQQGILRRQAVEPADQQRDQRRVGDACRLAIVACRSEEHTSELQSRENLVCRLLLEKKKKHAKRSSHCRLTAQHSVLTV